MFTVAILNTCSSSLDAAMYPIMLCISSCVPPLLRKYLISPYRDVCIVLRSSGAKSLSLQPLLTKKTRTVKKKVFLHYTLCDLWVYQAPKASSASGYFHFVILNISLLIHPLLVLVTLPPYPWSDMQDDKVGIPSSAFDFWSLINPQIWT